MPKTPSLDLNALLYFARVVECGSFTGAARSLAIPKSRLSRQVAELEQRLGVRLLHRSTRHLSLTETGRLYYRHCAALAEQAASAQEVIDRVSAEPSGLLRVAAPVTLSQQLLARVLPDFLLRHPKINLCVEATNREVDPVEEGFDLVLRVKVPPLEDSSLVCAPLGLNRRCLVASPALLDRYPAPDSPLALADLPALLIGCELSAPTWQFLGPKGEAVSVPLRTVRVASNDLTTLHQGALAGLGFAVLPQVAACRDSLASGELVRVLPEWEVPAGLIHVLYPSRHGMLPSVRSFIDYLSSRVPQSFSVNPPLPTGRC